MVSPKPCPLPVSRGAKRGGEGIYEDKGVDDCVDKTHGTTRNVLGGCLECGRYCKDG